MTLGNGSQNAIEYFTIEIKKALQRIGAELIMPHDCLFLIPEDYYCNLPCIFHSDNNTQDLLNVTIKGFKFLLERLILSSKRKVLSISLAWNICIRQGSMSECDGTCLRFIFMV